MAEYTEAMELAMACIACFDTCAADVAGELREQHGIPATEAMIAAQGALLWLVAFDLIVAKEPDFEVEDQPDSGPLFTAKDPAAFAAAHAEAQRQLRAARK